MLRSVSDGKSVLAANMNGVETHRDGVAGFVNNSTSATVSQSSSKESQKKKDEGEFIYKILKDLVTITYHHLP